MTTDELRQRFLHFFATKDHKIYPSDSLVPHNDPTLLFTSAGMNQFKSEFLGKPTKFRRRATCQKCLRTDDLDKVGRSSSHHTFFEMLGNFSFGDYFKEEAIHYAWEFVTGELNLPRERLWVSVYQEDQEAYQIWQDKIGLAEERIIKLGPKENFWPANAPEEGPDGPCGPCSEIFYDLGKNVGCGRPHCQPGCDCGRFVETWNLVFTQFDRKGKNNLEPLPNKNIDTGMGLERMAAVLQGVSSNFEIDIFQPIIEQLMHSSPLGGKIISPAQYSARNAIVDHIRAITFAIADGVLPSNDERGYVVRKLIRRSVWHGRNLKIKKPYLYKIVPTVMRVMKAAYPQLERKREDIAQVVLAEEKRFHQTLERAVSFAKDMINQLKAEGKTQLPGEIAFKLYDTYGLPQEMLQLLVRSGGLELDSQGFSRELELQRKSSRTASQMKEAVFVGTLTSRFKLKASKFVGDKKYVIETKVCALFKDEQPIKQAKANDEIKIVLESTPFYGESGGQIGDSGLISNKDVKIEILDTHKIDQTFFHLGKVISGKVKLNDKIKAEINLSRRQDIARNHTATHLLQAALRKVLGEHVRQSGSWVGEERLRFDFTHFQALSGREIKRVEELVNVAIKEDIKVEVLVMNFAQAQKLGALAFFGEKYEEKVRVIKIGDISLELCGGTHVSSTGEIGMFKIIGESSVASGIRRIEALTAKKAQETLKQRKDQFKELIQTFGAQEEKLPELVENLSSKVKALDKRLQNLRIENFKSRIDEIISETCEISGVKLIVQEIKSADMHILRLMADLLRQKVRPSIIVLASIWEEKVLIVCALTKELLAQGLDAVKIVRRLAEEVSGSGGGRADFAQAGGSNIAGLKKVLAKTKEVVMEEWKQ